ncbi:MAG: nucleoside hydrolase [Anaerolineaceae bacterium]|nr:nucleoside hydrolase [Anaerolineaceae bacterium]MCY3936433.1 nucleoside hydrolase [Chloroflexota bacterium]MCY4009167.1 nucleoside hydrolase [Anaerolineaceae bacterium]MCY4106491.1 nucleoside hydrolase [Chloroflexota bacterium]
MRSETTDDSAIPVLIDTDPGMDDSLAIITALKSPLLRVVGISAVSGNLPAARCYQNIHTILHLMGRADIPTAQGASVTLSRELANDPYSHGEDGLGETGLAPAPLPAAIDYAPSFIAGQVRAASAKGQPLTLLAFGPLTNIALAWMEEPRLPQLVERLIIIGGAFGLQREAALYATGDNPVSEWNVYVDPEAARRVFHAGFALTAVGLDVATHRDLRLLPEDEAALRASSLPEARHAAGILDYVLGRGFKTYNFFIDSCAVVAAAQPALIETVCLHCDVETQGELTRGMTVTDVRNHFRWQELPLIAAAKDADFPRLRQFVLSNLLAE